MVAFFDDSPEGGYISVDQAARLLGLPADEMVGLNMVILVPDGHGDVHVPVWCTHPPVATVMPLLSDHFLGEALEFCLTHMQPKGDGQNGVDLIQAGDWRSVHDMLRTLRRRFDQIMQQSRTAAWLARYGNGAAEAAPFRV